MQLNELKLITASNIIRLRQNSGLTQAELGAKLNYSDKSISKWERGEAIPDAFVLLQMAEIFGVNVDYMLSSHDKWEPPAEEETAAEEQTVTVYSINLLVAVTMLGVFTMALTVFVILGLFNIIWWPVFVVALPVALLTLVVLLGVFHRTRYLQYAISGFVVSLFLMLYVLMLPTGNHWQIFLISIPAIVVVFLSCNINIKTGKLEPFWKKKK